MGVICGGGTRGVPTNSFAMIMFFVGAVYMTIYGLANDTVLLIPPE